MPYVVMIAIPALIIIGITIGLTAGWYLRPRLRWCPTCGYQLRCDHCSRHAQPQKRSVA